MLSRRPSTGSQEIKRLHGGVDVYAPHASVRIDAEIGEKSRFRMKTTSFALSQHALCGVWACFIEGLINPADKGGCWPNIHGRAPRKFAMY